jgi:very-short-patch-repair endonuclease
VIPATRKKVRGRDNTSMGRIHTNDRGDAALARIAADQYGLFTTDQARSFRIEEDGIGRRLRSGLIVREHPRVFRFAAVPPSFKQQLKAVTLWRPGKIWASHRGAAAFWKLDEVPEGTIEVSTSCNLRTTRPDVIVHRISATPNRDVTEVARIPVSTVHRTLIDLGAVVEADAVELALECALRRHMTSIDRLIRRLEQTAGKGRRGAGVLRLVLERRDPLASPTESALETRFLQLLRRHRLPLPARQRVVRDEAGFVARVDFIYLDADLVVEVDSRRHHLNPKDWERDLRRRNRLTASGKRVLHVTYARMKNDPSGLAREIGNALGLSLA